MSETASIGRIALAILLSGFVSSLTDWLFAGVMFHSKYMAHPEIWRRTPGANMKGENQAVAWSTLLGFVTCAAFVCTCLAFQVRGYTAALELAAAIWVMAPLPLLIVNALFIKMHPLTVASLSLGWLAKLLLAGAAVGWLLS
ncbi:MAG TPA: hypothetical protein VJN90_05665 [Candidatus Acidoferrales bacterium]|nr:hypothetical protein [Candidatus Acidoferrales bacterium]